MAVVELLDSGCYDMAKVENESKGRTCEIYVSENGQSPMILPITVNV